MALKLPPSTDFDSGAQCVCVGECGLAHTTPIGNQEPPSRSTPGHEVFLEAQDGGPSQGSPQPPSGPPSS
eukprot:5416365-Prymnesium_polylepis.1